MGICREPGNLNQGSVLLGWVRGWILGNRFSEVVDVTNGIGLVCRNNSTIVVYNKS